MNWEIKKRGRVTYYRKKTNDVFSDLVVEELDNGDLKIRFVGMTGAIAATNELGLDEIARMDPAREIPRIFDTWEMYVREAGVCDSLAELDFLEVHSFGAAPKAPSPFTEPEQYAAEKNASARPTPRPMPSTGRKKCPTTACPCALPSISKSCPTSTPVMNSAQWRCCRNLENAAGPDPSLRGRFLLAGLDNTPGQAPTPTGTPCPPPANSQRKKPSWPGRTSPTPG